jgi:hypothetical protein
MIICQIANLLQKAGHTGSVGNWCKSGFRADQILSKQYDPQL